MFFVFFFFKQKTAYEMRISDWSSDVCSSDLIVRDVVERHGVGLLQSAASASPVTKRLLGQGVDLSCLGEFILKCRAGTLLTGIDLRHPFVRCAAELDTGQDHGVGRCTGIGYEQIGETTSEHQSLMRSW